MKKTIGFKKNIPLIIIAAVLLFLIVCPLIMIFAKAVIRDDRLDFITAWQTLTESENAQMIFNSLLPGVLVVIVSTIIAAPLAYLFSRTSFAKYRCFDVIFMIPFMTPPYIASMGWILFMQKRGLLQQLFPAAAGSENWFFTLGGLVLGQHRTITGLRLCHLLACIFSAILHKFRLTGDSPPALNLYNLTKNLTAQSNDNNYAVLP